MSRAYLRVWHPSDSFSEDSRSDHCILDSLLEYCSSESDEYTHRHAIKLGFKYLKVDLEECSSRFSESVPCQERWCPLPVQDPVATS